MKNSVSDFVASSMDAIMKSKEHKQLFNKFASTMCEKCKEEDCKCDAAMADTKKEPVEVEKEDEAAADTADVSEANDVLSVEAQLSIAIDSLLVASSALDAVGFEKSAEHSLKIAAFVSEAKKAKDMKKLDALKKKKEDEKKKKEKDVQMAKDKKVKEKAKAEKEKADAKAKAEKEKAKEKAAKEKEEEAAAKAKAKAKK